MKLYKIRHLKTGQFSDGGGYGWSKSGRTYATLGAARNGWGARQRNVYTDYECRVENAYDGEAEIVEFEMTEIGTVPPVRPAKGTL